ncbi:MAG TPA: MmpS family transport accessory protein [Mycobacterium sp.]|nr:MmpS family transport accessory protein [Mycobacterium sp.]
MTPDVRAATKADNAVAASRKVSNSPHPAPNSPQQPSAPASHNVVFEITGSGIVYSIDIDPGGRAATENTAMPWKRSVTIGPDVQLIQVVTVGKTGTQGCRITVDGKVVKDQPNDPHCVFTLP